MLKKLGYYPTTVRQCDQTTVWITRRVMCREEVGQSLQGQVRLVLRVRLQHGNNRDRVVGGFSARWWWLGIFAVEALRRLPNKHVPVRDPFMAVPRNVSHPLKEFA